MKGIYILNTHRHTLHIYGHCRHGYSKDPKYKFFDSEDEARKYDGMSIGWCKLCLKEREKRLLENTKNR